MGGIRKGNRNTGWNAVSRAAQISSGVSSEEQNADTRVDNDDCS